jgi:hypothetical protein
MKAAGDDVELCAHCGVPNWPAHKQARLAPEQRTRETAQAAAPPRAPLGGRRVRNVLGADEPEHTYSATLWACVSLGVLRGDVVVHGEAALPLVPHSVAAGAGAVV